MLRKFIRQKIKQRAAKKEVKIEKQKEFFQKFDKFVKVSKVLAPKSPKNPQSGLFQYCWRRAVVLQRFYSSRGDKNNSSFYDKAALLSKSLYYKYAPRSDFGVKRLKMNCVMYDRFLIKESDMGNIEITDNDLLTDKYNMF